MRILQVTPAYLPAVRYGGPIFATHALCKALVTRGHSVEVYTTDQDASAGNAGTLRILDDVAVSYFPSNYLQRLAWAPGLAARLATTIGQFDIVHLHSTFLWPTWAAARRARKAHIPYVLSPRGMLVKELIRRRNRLVKSAWMGLAERSNLEHASAIHVTSELEERELAAFGWRLPRVSVIANGVEDEPETGTISADVMEAAQSRPYVLYLGRLSWKKGLDRLLHAFATTKHGMLVIAGTDDEGLSSGLCKLADELKVSARVRIIPRTVLGADKAHLFSNARVFVLPSYSENFGNAVLEALAAGVPVVVTPDVGAAEIVSRASGGVIASGEPAVLGTAIARFMDDESLARQTGKAGRQYVLENCSWAGVAAEMENLYRQCLRTVSA